MIFGWIRGCGSFDWRLCFLGWWWGSCCFAFGRGLFLAVVGMLSFIVLQFCLQNCLCFGRLCVLLAAGRSCFLIRQRNCRFGRFLGFIMLFSVVWVARWFCSFGLGFLAFVSRFVSENFTDQFYHFNFIKYLIFKDLAYFKNFINLWCHFFYLDDLQVDDHRSKLLITY